MIGLKIEEGVVIGAAVFKDAESLFEGYIQGSDGVGIGWTDNGDGSFSAPEPPVKNLTNDEKIAIFRETVSSAIDAAARSAGPFGFDSIITAVSYADDMEDALNQPHGAALKAYRRECWDYARSMLETWMGGGGEPSLEEFTAGMPEYVDP